MNELTSSVIGHPLGNIFFVMIVTEILLHKDPIKYGSGNPGTANTGAVFGKKWGTLTYIGDLARTLTALLIVYLPYHGNRLDLSFAGIGVVLGHLLPFWNHFRGGKRVAVTALWIVFFDWRAGLIILLIDSFLVITMKNLTIPPPVYVLGFSIFTWLGFGWEQRLIFLITTLIMIFQFREDTVDLLTGHGR